MTENTPVPSLLYPSEVKQLQELTPDDWLILIASAREELDRFIQREEQRRDGLNAFLQAIEQYV